jgi:hypothetical protein
MDEMKKDGPFSKINGPPAQILIIAGLVLVLLAPLIPSFKLARVAHAQTEFSQVDTLMEVDLEDLKRTQAREQKEDVAAAQQDRSTPINYSGGAEQVQKQQQERQAREIARQNREVERQKVLDDKTEELKKKYDANDRKRTLLEAQIAATGMRWHLFLLFLGNLMLLVGLLALTLESDGTRQKVVLIILLVVMFSALSGINLTFFTSAGVGNQAFEHLKSP